ncbi:hypothetical protein [Thalassotalea agarivorans]|uniref:Uncharacterized protein n=1 Tax=Thalassotalea agarivorans TaxID=349064 RepID=A0A1I0HFS3_THASX|nr:hypothetical protein [Thalassotalea agarivorans]SET82698.1 hypothetical protein SAMN05660429_02789 [Thalassotalea agarivorans]
MKKWIIIIILLALFVAYFFGPSAPSNEKVESLADGEPEISGAIENTSKNKNKEPVEDKVNLAEVALTMDKPRDFEQECLVKMTAIAISQADVFDNLDSYSESLRDTGDIQAQLSYALMHINYPAVYGTETTIVEREDILNELYQLWRADQNDKAAYAYLFQQCMVEQAEYCSDTFLSQYSTVDAENAYYDHLLFNQAIAKQDGITAQYYLAQASNKARYDLYFYKHARIINQTLNSRLNLNKGLAFAPAINATTKNLPAYNPLIDYCIKNESLSPVDLEHCGQLGQLMAEKSHELLSQSIGYELEESYYKKTGKTGLEKVAIQRRSSKAVNHLFSTVPVFTMAVVDEDIADLWFQTGAEEGETAAMIKIAVKVTELADNPDYRPCGS